MDSGCAGSPERKANGIHPGYRLSDDELLIAITEQRTCAQIDQHTSGKAMCRVASHVIRNRPNAVSHAAWKRR